MLENDFFQFAFFLILCYASTTKINARDIQQLATIDPVVLKFNFDQLHFKPNRSVIVELFEWKFDDVANECVNFLGPKGYAGVLLSPVTEHLIVRNAATPTTDDGQQSTTGPDRPWWERYQPISYNIASRSGNAEELQAMSRACNDAGVRVYIDVVLNHMTGGLQQQQRQQQQQFDNENVNENEYDNENEDDVEYIGMAGAKAIPAKLEYPGVPYSAKHFHKPCLLRNYSNVYEIQNCQVDGQPDLDQSTLYVRSALSEFLNGLISMGIAGFRIHGAKHIQHEDLQHIFSDLMYMNTEFDFPELSSPSIFLDVVDLGTDVVSKSVYIDNCLLDEYLYAAALSMVFKGNAPLNTLINWGPSMGFIAHKFAIVFVDGHASQRHGYLRELGQNRLLTFRERHKYIAANAFMLAHPYGKIKRIMSSYYFDTNDDGPPTATGTVTTANVAAADGSEVDAQEVEADPEANAEAVAEPDEVEMEQIRSPEFIDDDASAGQCAVASGWICEHRWPEIANMLALVNSLDELEDPVMNFQTFGINHIAFCRGYKAFIAINNDAELDYATKVHTCLEPGIYCDVISGGINADGTDCLGKRITVHADGTIDLLLLAIKDNQSNNEKNSKIVNIESNGVGQTGDNNVDDSEAAVSSMVEANQDYGVIAIYIGSKLMGNDNGNGNGNGNSNDDGEENKQRYVVTTMNILKSVLESEEMFGEIDRKSIREIGNANDMQSNEVAIDDDNVEGDDGAGSEEDAGEEVKADGVECEQAASNEAEAVEAEAIEVEAVEAEAVEGEVDAAQAIERDAVESEPVEAEAVEAEDAEAAAVEAEDVPAEAVEAGEVEAEDAEGEANAVEGDAADAVETEDAQAVAVEAEEVEDKAVEGEVDAAEGEAAEAVEAEDQAVDKGENEQDANQKTEENGEQGEETEVEADGDANVNEEAEVTAPEDVHDHDSEEVMLADATISSTHIEIDFNAVNITETESPPSQPKFAITPGYTGNYSITINVTTYEPTDSEVQSTKMKANKAASSPP